jgi:diguanylate cyclase (GGDEF)-like protein
MEKSDRLGSSYGSFPQNMLEILLAQEVNRARRYPSPVSVLQMSLQFSQGSPAQFAESGQGAVIRMLNSTLRESDLPGQYQGNFLIVLPGTYSAGARIAAERLMAAISGASPFRDTEAVEVAVNIGVASHPGGEGISMSRLLSETSSALVEARHRGLRTIVAFGEIEGQPAKPVC